ncbi:CU044_5270 family protein [Cellulomonas sp. NPDC089187]|uniref:CU044_5270 family protein n=1 Tax=Cellulomonas sp. NPDC089187 TaxID=3154970 RepID=UPI0034201353
MSDPTPERRAQAEVEALSALLGRVGLGGTLPAEPVDEVQMRAQIAALTGDPVQAEVVPLRPRRRWAVLTGAAAAVLLGIGAALIPAHLGAPSAVATTPPMLAYPIAPTELAAGAGPSAAPVLAELADIAANRVDPEPAGTVQHTLSQSWLLSVSVEEEGTSVAVEPTVGETWTAADGSATFVQWRGPALDSTGRLAEVPAVDTTAANAAVDRMPAGTFDPDQAAALPRDPAALRAELLAGLSAPGCDRTDSPDTAVCLYLAVTDLADRLVLPADLDAALWQVLAAEPGISLAGEVTDRVGEVAVALAFPGASWDTDPVVRVLLVDPSTGAIVGREEVTLSSTALDIDTPTVTQFRYDLEVGWTEATGPAH